MGLGVGVGVTLGEHVWVTEGEAVGEVVVVPVVVGVVVKLSVGDTAEQPNSWTKFKLLSATYTMPSPNATPHGVLN